MKTKSVADRIIALRSNELRRKKRRERNEGRREEWLADAEAIKDFFMRKLDGSSYERKALRSFLDSERPELAVSYDFIEIGSRQKNKDWYDSCREALKKIYEGTEEKIVDGRVLLYKRN